MDLSPSITIYNCMTLGSHLTFCACFFIYEMEAILAPTLESQVVKMIKQLI